MRAACRHEDAALPDSRALLRATHLADAAVRALIAEAELTPKPALVDQRGSGAHRDLDLDALLRSARSLRGGFQDMALEAGLTPTDVALREALGAIGRRAERSMLTATGGANAHRGAIWVLGLLVAGRALGVPGESAVATAERAGRIARLPDRHAGVSHSHGAIVCARYGVGGARAEAAAAFPHVVKIGLPALRHAREAGAKESCAQLDALLAIMTSLDDTCLLHRGGRVALRVAQRGARRVLALGGSASVSGRRALLTLDAALQRRYASPGGCADLLAACLFLDDTLMREL
jgi:triphosphoribosyl-dephospho-CoA synthase